MLGETAYDSRPGTRSACLAETLNLLRIPPPPVHTQASFLAAGSEGTALLLWSQRVALLKGRFEEPGLGSRGFSNKSLPLPSVLQTSGDCDYFSLSSAILVLRTSPSHLLWLS